MISTPIRAAAAVPSSWVEAYVGLPYAVGTGECAQRAALVWREVFGFDIDPPAAFGDLAVAQDLIRAELASGAWDMVRQPCEGDAVLMWKGALLCHVGVWVAPGHVLHCTRRDGMVLTAEADVAEGGFRVAGYARRRPAMAMAA